MATNQVYNHGDQWDVPASAVTPSDPESGDPVLVGQLPAVALTGVWTDATGTDRVTVKTNGVYELPVTGESGAVSIGTIVYFDTSDEGLNDSSSDNVRYGYALGAVGNGSTTVIPVKIGY